MVSLQKVFPCGVEANPRFAFRIALLADGYTLAERDVFMGLCALFVRRFLDTAPFGLTRRRPGWVAIYRHFVPGTLGGAVTATDPANPSNLIIDQDKLKALCQAVTVPVDSGTMVLYDAMPSLGVEAGLSGTLVALVRPSTGNLGSDGEAIPDGDSRYAVATTADGEWHQVVLRGVARMLGLGVEYDLPGDVNLKPSDPWSLSSTYFNLEQYDSPPVLNADCGKWQSLMTAQQALLPATIIRKGVDDGQQNSTLDAPPYARDVFTLWEGGGGFRSQTYRTAADCLLRRQPGNPLLPLRAGRLPMCPACMAFLSNAVGG